ncbi:inositol polyphosphate 5-phosphatase INPP5B/F [Entomortierella parvispora]|uniref:Inositol polyphosphate 5-phosphatase INPP5B/F n=1 Tax=Entomortierella parvispora TaxID=205924 RepID=A0A9P3HHS2_9FUNG|nr:inositol polyphosphate 5-phosphatase INPP5B/F [Entomortierella parvispora]
MGKDNHLENRILAIIVNTQAGVEESCVFIIKRTGQVASVLQTVLPIYFDFRISVAQTKAVDKDDKTAAADVRNGNEEECPRAIYEFYHAFNFTLKLYCDQTEVTVQTDDLDVLQGLLRELRRSHLIAQDDNFYAGGSSHHWIQYYTRDESNQSTADQVRGMTMDEFIASASNPLAMYFLQPEAIDSVQATTAPRLDLGLVKESWIEKEMRARESEFTEHSYMHAFVGTWNVNGKNVTEKLDAWLHVDGKVQPDIYVLCFQELDLSAEAYIVFDGSKEEEWTRAIADSLGTNYKRVMSKQLVGLFIIMFAAEDHVEYIKEVTTHAAGVGIMGILANKGGVSIRIRYKDSYLCFVGSHLAADTSQIDRRNQDYQEICRRLTFPSSNFYDITKSPAGNAALAGGNRMVSIFDCDHTIWAGDLNYRIGLGEEQVKSYLKTNDYEALMKHDQLASQRSLFKAFSEFEEHPISFHPTYKYDVGTSIWDSSEKRRVPSYTDRILWRSKDTSEDSAKPLFYRSTMELTLSDHKPVSAMFRLKVKTLLHDKQAEVFQAIVRDLDRFENECMPDATVSSSNVTFEAVRYLVPQKTTITVKNIKEFPAQYRFKPKLQDDRFCKPWLWVNPPLGMIMPGESAEIQVTVLVDNDSAPMLNTGKEQMEDILVLHLEHGKDYFITVSGEYIRTCFGNSLEWLSRLDRPIRLWNPAEDDDDEDDIDDAATVYDPFNVLGTKSSRSSMRATPSVNSVSTTTVGVAGGRDSSVDLVGKQVKNAKSLDSLSERGTLDRNTLSALAGGTRKLKMTSSSSDLTEKPKKPKAARQLSLPKDLWRIVDFIYKNGFGVDNLFLLSGDQATMAYIRECLDTGEDFDLGRLLDKPPSGSVTEKDSGIKKARDGQDNDKKSKGKKNKKGKQNDATKASESTEDDDGHDDQDQEKKAPAAAVRPSTLTPRGSASDIKPQIARPVSILNGIPPKAATFGLGENRGIHSMAEVLLRFLESLREPVVPTEMYYRALEVANHQQAAYGLLDLMPPVHVNVFVYITSFLREMILVGGSAGQASNASPDGSGQGGATGPGSSTQTLGGSANVTNRVLQSSSGSIYNGNDAASISGRGKRDDEDHRVSRLATVFSSVMLRPPPGAERLSEVEALKRKTFLMQFLQEPVEEDGAHPSATGGASNAGGGGSAGYGTMSGSTAAAAATALKHHHSSTASAGGAGHDTIETLM